MTGVVVVTGGASGIGRAVVEAVTAEGGRAAVLDLPGAALEATRAAFGAERVRCAPVDVSDEAAVTAEIGAIERDFGPIAGLVNSAGIGADVAALATDAALVRRMMEVNVVGSFVVARETAKAMRGRGGAIVNVASVSGIQGNEGRVAYGASKGAVIAMSRVMAVELAEFGIRVNVIAPGPIETPLVARVHTEEVRATWMASVPMKRYGAPEDIAAAAVFLLDAAKSGYITGQTLCVDGGFTIAGLLSGTARGANEVA